MFTRVGPIAALHAAADAAAAALPSIGSAKPSGFVCLCHFSDNPNILLFTGNPGICNWLDGFSVQGRKVGAMTNINNVSAVNSLYVVRVGFSMATAFQSTLELPICKSKGGAFEFSIL